MLSITFFRKEIIFEILVKHVKKIGGKLYGRFLREGRMLPIAVAEIFVIMLFCVHFESQLEVRYLGVMTVLHLAAPSHNLACPVVCESSSRLVQAPSFDCGPFFN